MTFDVYPKEGKTFSLKCTALTIAGGGVDLRNSDSGHPEHGFLPLSRIAAIIPRQSVMTQETKTRFLVYLAGRESFSFFADAFSSENDKVTFQMRQNDSSGRCEELTPVEDVYVDLSEVVAIFPSSMETPSE